MPFAISVTGFLAADSNGMQKPHIRVVVIVATLTVLFCGAFLAFNKTQAESVLSTISATGTIGTLNFQCPTSAYDYLIIYTSDNATITSQGSSVGGCTPPTDPTFSNQTMLSIYGFQVTGTYYIFSYQGDLTDFNACSAGNSISLCVANSKEYFRANYDGTQWTTGVDWNLINVAPAVPYGAITFATSSASLFAAFSTTTIAVSCATGNVFSDALCAAGTFLFIPNPTILNQYLQLPSIQQTHFPFSWLYQVQSTINTQSASTGNLPTYSLDLATVDPSTSTPLGGVLPNFTFFSSSTVMAYLPSSDWSNLQALLAAVLWLGLVVDIFFVLRNRFHRV